MRCVEQATCAMGQNYSRECRALEANMPCSLNCPGSDAHDAHSAPSMRWSWGPSEWPCVSDLPADPEDPGVVVEAASDTAWIVATLLGSAVVLVILLAICCCTWRHVRKGREAMEADWGLAQTRFSEDPCPYHCRGDVRQSLMQPWLLQCSLAKLAKLSKACSSS